MFFFANISSIVNRMWEKIFPFEAIAEHVQAIPNYYTGFSKYSNEFMTPYLTALSYFVQIEKARVLGAPPIEIYKSYADLMKFNFDIGAKFLSGSMKAVQEYARKETTDAVSAFLKTAMDPKSEEMEAFLRQRSRNISAVANDYPKAIDDIEPEFGFHFERGDNEKVAETERFVVYRINPTDEGVEIREDGKPILIVPPYVLGANILAFLPGEGKSYAHSFANQGIPTYIRIMKDIAKTPAVQLMTPEDDALDTAHFCERIKDRHGKPVTLNGYCQGGYTSVMNILSGQLDGLVDALITCVAPMDGSRSESLGAFLRALPKDFNDLIYGTKTLPNGNQVADGSLMSWIYKLRSVETETPVVAFLRDMAMLAPRNGRKINIAKTAAAINYWLENERTDIPLAIVKASFESYNEPVAEDGTLPVTLFGRKLNFKGIREKGIKWLLCYGEKDDLVEPEVALAPLDYIDVEVSPFPKGHVAIATSWSKPDSKFQLHGRFGKNNEYRGPVRFQLDLEEQLEEEEPDESSSSSDESDDNLPTASPAMSLLAS